MVDKSPEFFLKIISSGQDIDSKARELALDLCDSFPVLELLKQPLPYNFEFIHFVANNAGQNIKRIEKYYKIKGKPQDFNQWKDKYIKKLQAEYQDWKEIKNLVFSYFVITNSTDGFIGVLNARLEDHDRNIPDMHITGANHPPGILRCMRKSFLLVDYYLRSALKIPKLEAQKALDPIVIDWDWPKSTISQFKEMKGSSFVFLFTSLCLASALRSLLGNGVIVAIDKLSSQKLEIEEILLPSNILMSGDFEDPPDNSTWHHPYIPIKTKAVASSPIKLSAATGINKVYNHFFAEFILPKENQADMSDREMNTEINLTYIEDMDGLVKKVFPHIEINSIAPSEVISSWEKDAMTSSNVKGEVMSSLMRKRSVHLVAHDTADWKTLVDDIVKDMPENFKKVQIDLYDPATSSQEGLIEEIRKRLSKTEEDDGTNKLTNLARIIKASSSEIFLVLLHFDIIRHRLNISPSNPEIAYTTDLFTSLRFWITDMRPKKLLILLQSRSPLPDLLPQDVMSSPIDIQTIHLK